jgi:hypothetical protein
MTPEDKAYLSAFNARLDELESQDRYDELDALVKANPWAMSYDSRGRYVGPVANENGWTA